ncbi:MAG: ferredoxin--NADP reductase [Robiginitomaculum sp.]|nr:ferredoxin--NADP reductase [Robiginitomaculum sp.]
MPPTNPKLNPNTPTTQTVLSVNHYTDQLFAFSISRPPSFRFRSGEFIMIGLQGEKKPLLRAYSIASPSWDEKLDFYSIKVPDGPLTSRLQNIENGNEVLLGRKPVGTLVLDALLPGKRLFMLATGTGIAPFASLIRDPDVYENFEQVILVHTCRQIAELTYGFDLVAAAKADPLVGEWATEKLQHIPSATREAYALQGRITTLIETHALFDNIKGGSFDPRTDRIMICGSIAMTKDLKTLAEAYGFKEGANSNPADFVIEKSFVG